jgi:hypothetical protein
VIIIFLKSEYSALLFIFFVSRSLQERYTLLVRIIKSIRPDAVPGRIDLDVPLLPGMGRALEILPIVNELY